MVPTNVKNILCNNKPKRELKQYLIEIAPYLLVEVFPGKT